MHTIDSSNTNIRTDLVLDFDIKSNKIISSDGVTLYNSTKDNYNYSTITFIDCTDHDMISKIETILINELKRYLKTNSKVLIVGLGNNDLTSDSIGPKTIKHIIPNSHIYNNLITKSNTLFDHDKDISTYTSTIIDYVDYNKDGEYSGKNITDEGNLEYEKK